MDGKAQGRFPCEVVSMLPIEMFETTEYFEKLNDKAQGRFPCEVVSMLPIEMFETSEYFEKMWSEGFVL
jgi:hypothetical protein